MNFILKICLKYLSYQEQYKRLGTYGYSGYSEPTGRKTGKSQFIGNHNIFLPFSHSSKIKKSTTQYDRLHISQPHSDEITDQMLI